MQISLLRILLLRFFKTITIILLMRFFMGYLFCSHSINFLFSNTLQGVLALCEFHYCEFCYCGFSKPLLKICLMRFLCTINFVNAVIFLMRFLANASFFRSQKSHKARTLCNFLVNIQGIIVTYQVTLNSNLFYVLATTYAVQ